MNAIRQDGDLTNHELTIESFPAFYRMLLGLRFPIDVADVIEIRGIINTSADHFNTPPQTPDYRQFVDAMESAIDSFGIDNKRHVDKLTKVMTMMRELHYQHSVESRDQENALRLRQEENQHARAQSIIYGLGTLLLTIFSIILWVSMGEPSWYIKLSAILFSFVTWDYFHSLTTLSKETRVLMQELNDTLRKRIVSLNWKQLIHKLSLVLGYKKVSGVNVFLFEDSNYDRSHNFH